MNYSEAKGKLDNFLSIIEKDWRLMNELKILSLEANDADEYKDSKAYRLKIKKQFAELNKIKNEMLRLFKNNLEMQKQVKDEFDHLFIGLDHINPLSKTWRHKALKKDTKSGPKTYPKKLSEYIIELANNHKNIEKEKKGEFAYNLIQFFKRNGEFDKWIQTRTEGVLNGPRVRTPRTKKRAKPDDSYDEKWLIEGFFRDQRKLLKIEKPSRNRKK